MRVYVSTLGCKLNESELEAWTRRFAADGHEIANDPRNADLCILNTCTVTHVAARKSRQMARQLARSNPEARLVLTGCYASASPGEAKVLPNVALVVPNAHKDRLVELAGALVSDSRFQTTETGCRLPEAASGELCSSEWMDADVETLVAGHKPRAASRIPRPRTRAFVKIQDGCNMSCTYCIIPLARGRERSRSSDDIVAEVGTLVSQGYQEIILTGVQISVYENGSDRSNGLRDLVAAILDQTSVPRLRLTSIAPWDLDASLLDLWRDPRLCRHLHLSLQSGSDTVLRRMRRPYTTARFARAVGLARERIADVGITTDVIVGFPGESEVESDDSMRFVEEMGFSRVHVFPYSAREGTVAGSLPLQVPDAVKEGRTKQMQAIADRSARAFARKFAGRMLSVLWEAREGRRKEVEDRGSGDGTVTSPRLRPLAGQRCWSGYTDNYIRVIAPSDADLANRITSAVLICATDDGAMAIACDASSRPAEREPLPSRIDPKVTVGAS